MRYNTALVYALLSSVIAAPSKDQEAKPAAQKVAADAQAVDQEFYLTVLSGKSNLDGKVVTSRDDGTLWLTTPSPQKQGELVASRRPDNLVAASKIGKTVSIAEDGSVRLAAASDKTDFFVAPNSMLATSNNSTIGSVCPKGNQFQLFWGTQACEGGSEVNLVATRNGVPINAIEMITKAIELQQNFLVGGDCGAFGAPGTAHLIRTAFDVVNPVTYLSLLNPWTYVRLLNPFVYIDALSGGDGYGTCPACSGRGDECYC